MPCLANIPTSPRIKGGLQSRRRRIPNCAANTLNELIAVIRLESVFPPGFTRALTTPWPSIGRHVARFGVVHERPAPARHAAIGV